jgi:hypothetical protein
MMCEKIEKREYVPSNTIKDRNTCQFLYDTLSSIIKTIVKFEKKLNPLQIYFISHEFLDSETCNEEFLNSLKLILYSENTYKDKLIMIFNLPVDLIINNENTTNNLEIILEIKLTKTTIIDSFSEDEEKSKIEISILPKVITNIEDDLYRKVINHLKIENLKIDKSYPLYTLISDIVDSVYWNIVEEKR